MHRSQAVICLSIFGLGPLGSERDVVQMTSRLMAETSPMVAGIGAQTTSAAIAASSVTSLLTPETTLAGVGGIQLPAPLAICTTNGGTITNIRTAPVTAPPATVQGSSS